MTTHPMTQREIEYAKRFIGLPWIRLEMEEQAFARRLMREGMARIEGDGPTRRIVWKRNTE